MTERMHQAKRPVSAALAGPYGHPYHPILVTIPIGAWISSLVFDIGSHIDTSAEYLTKSSTWLIAIGVVGALIAAATGALDLIAIPSGGAAFRTGIVHMSLNLAITVSFIVNFLWRHTDDNAGSVRIGQMVLSIVALIALAVSGYLGGKLAYHYGVRVADERTQATGYTHEQPAWTSKR